MVWPARRVATRFDVAQIRPKSSNIRVETTDALLKLSHGGYKLRIDGVLILDVPTPASWPCDVFANLIATSQGDVDASRFRQVADAFQLGLRVAAPAFLQ